MLITDSVEAAAAEVTGFWRNYDSLRWVEDQLVLRLRAEPRDEEVAALNEQFGALLEGGRIERSAPLGAERADQDRLEFPRLVLRLADRSVGALHRVIQSINALDSAPDARERPARRGAEGGGIRPS